ncbi:hypothetical protein OGZ02_16275 [Brachyspira hyodysenteriae]|nr:hypothetical protein [Brachyspira hyodysenteriae]MDA1470325.1 hypothetical protein [Brachyspira hyodysenteriae]
MLVILVFIGLSLVFSLLWVITSLLKTTRGMNAAIKLSCAVSVITGFLL